MEETNLFDEIRNLREKVDEESSDSCIRVSLLRSLKDLASKLRLIVSLKRQLDEVPSEAAITQYELRSSELNTQIQKKHRQARKHYDTYNALVECKELMLTETSLLDSITVQFQNANSSGGRIKLIKPLEGILEGIQQEHASQFKCFRSWRKQKRHCNLREINDALEEKYAATIREGRWSSSLLKLFQKNVRGTRTSGSDYMNSRPTSRA